nr:DUF6207 family protein [Streptomyces brasiliensis]
MQGTVDVTTDNSPGRVNPQPEPTPAGHEHVLTDVDQIREAHLSEPGLLVIDVAGFDDDTVLAFQAAIARTWGTATAERTTRDPGQPGVRLRMYTDMRQVLEEATASLRHGPGARWWCRAARRPGGRRSDRATV